VHIGGPVSYSDPLLEVSAKLTLVSRSACVSIRSSPVNADVPVFENRTTFQNKFWPRVCVCVCVCFSRSTYDRFTINSRRRREAWKNCTTKAPRTRFSSSSSGQISTRTFTTKPALSTASLASKYRRPPTSGPGRDFTHVFVSIPAFPCSRRYESSENMTITCSTKVCSFGKQVVEKVETEYARFENGRFVYRIHRSPMCEYMINFIHKLKHLPEKYMMNSVLENFTILQVYKLVIIIIIIYCNALTGPPLNVATVVTIVVVVVNRCLTAPHRWLPTEKPKRLYSVPRTCLKCPRRNTERNTTCTGWSKTNDVTCTRSFRTDGGRCDCRGRERERERERASRRPCCSSSSVSVVPLLFVRGQPKTRKTKYPKRLFIF